MMGAEGIKKLLEDMDKLVSRSLQFGNLVREVDSFAVPAGHHRLDLGVKERKLALSVRLARFRCGVFCTQLCGCQGRL